MAFKFSLGGAKANKAQLNSKAKAEEEAKEREEKLALDKVMADFEEEHGSSNNVLGESEVDREPDDVFVPTGSKRHFTGRQRSMKSGPGTLGPGPFGFPKPGGPSRNTHVQSKFGGSVPTGPASMEGPKQSENVFTTLVAKASNLPPDMDAHSVEKLFSDFPALKVTKVEKLPGPGLSFKGRPFASMKVVFNKDATARHLDEAMVKLNDKKYLGRGYYLHLDRYLGGKAMETVQDSLPFGARWEAPEAPKGYAPPPDLGGGSRDGSRQEKQRLVVRVSRPPDLKTTRLIHQVIEGVIKGGMEFEAALMNQPSVQEEERFAWLYDQRHPLNRYYRWQMYRLATGSSKNDFEIFKGIYFIGPTDPLPGEFADSLAALDLSEEEDDSDGEGEKPLHKPLPAGDNYPGRVDNGYGIMPPRSRALLMWLLTRVPPGGITVGDVAGVSQFAVEHAARGMDEVVQLLVTNILVPFHLSQATEGKGEARRPDTRQVTVNALRIVSDVLFTMSKESGAAYKYRGLICNELVDRKVFEYLEKLPAKLEMGRVTEKGYRDEINSILKVWGDELFFEKSTLEHIDEVFNGPERQKERDEHARKMAEKKKRKALPKASTTPLAGGAKEDDGGDDGDVQEGEERKGVERSVPQPVLTTGDSEQQSVQVEHSEGGGGDVKQTSVPEEIPGETAAARARRLRPKAEDMFASDEE